MLLEKIPAVSGEKEKTIAEKAAAFIIGLCVILVVLITAVQAVCYWIPDWWRNEYEKYDTPSNVTGEMSLDDAVHVTEDMLEYCIGRLDTLDETEATIDGVTAPFFTNREKMHLADCRRIFQSAIRARIIAVLLSVALFIYIYIHRGRHGALQLAARGYLFALAAVLAAAVILLVIAMHDFTYAFTEFHHIFFDNDLWILYPDKDNLINIMQEQVFADAAATIAAIWGSVCLMIAAAAGLQVHRGSAAKK